MLQINYSGNQVMKKSIYRIMNFVYRNNFITEFKVSMDFKILKNINLKRFHRRLRCFGLVITDRVQLRDNNRQMVKGKRGNMNKGPSNTQYISNYANMAAVKRARISMTRTFGD